MKNSLISIAMATYNGEKYLKEQLDSIYAQTYKNIEVIVTDDCSTDQTVKILEQYARSHGLKYYVNQKNLGFIKNFERAISLCSGGYIALSDQDDIWLPHKISTLLLKIDEHMLIASDATLIDENNQIIANSFQKYTTLFVPDKIIWEHLIWYNFMTGCTMLFKRELLKDALPFSNDIQMHDWWLAEIAAKNNSICYVDEQLVKYRQHNTSVTGIAKTKSFFSELYGFFKLSRVKEETAKYKYAKIQEVRLQHHLSLPFFSLEQKKILKDAFNYYNDYTNNVFHYKRFWLALRYYRLLGVQKKSFIFKIKWFIGELIG